MTECASPLQIIIMLICYYSPKPVSEIDVSRWHSQAADEIREQLRRDGLIDDSNRATERGRAWVDYICRTPLPVQSWILPERK